MEAATDQPPAETVPPAAAATASEVMPEEKPELQTEEKLKLQQQEATRRESVLVMRLATKEQEMQELLAQIHELKQARPPSTNQLQEMLLDPAINILFDKMKSELNDTKGKLEQAQNDLSAWKFTPDSVTGKKLMGKCRMLLQENQELGKQLSQGRIAQLEAELSLQKKYSEELKESQDELNEFVIQLDEEVEGMQSTICTLQQQLKDAKAQLELVSRENESLHRDMATLDPTYVPSKANATVAKTMEAADQDMGEDIGEDLPPQGQESAAVEEQPMDKTCNDHTSNDLHAEEEMNHVAAQHGEGAPESPPSQKNSIEVQDSSLPNDLDSIPPPPQEEANTEETSNEDTQTMDPPADQHVEQPDQHAFDEQQQPPSSPKKKPSLTTTLQPPSLPQQRKPSSPQQQPQQPQRKRTRRSTSSSSKEEETAVKKSTRRLSSAQQNSTTKRRGAAAAAAVTAASADEDEDEECAVPMSLEQHDIVFGPAKSSNTAAGNKPHNSDSESGGSVVFPIIGNNATAATTAVSTDAAARALKSPSQSPEYMNQEYTDRVNLLKEQKERTAVPYAIAMMMADATKGDAGDFAATPAEEEEFENGATNDDHPALDGKIDDSAV